MPFETELNLIKNPSIKMFAEKLLEIVPEYFYHIPASTTGKYHPQYVLGEGGLYRHVQAAVKLALHIMSLEQCTLTNDEKDLVVVSIMFHDCWKTGDNPKGYTIHDHPIVASDKIMRFTENLGLEYKLDYGKVIAENISSHMGQWTTSTYSAVTLPKPTTEMQKIVHLADYLASRKDIEVLI